VQISARVSDLAVANTPGVAFAPRKENARKRGGCPYTAIMVVRLPKPADSLSSRGNDIADPKLVDLVMPFMADEDPDYRVIITALRIAFWRAFWEECSALDDEVARQFLLARRFSARGIMRAGAANIETAARRGRTTAYEWAGPQWRGASYERGSSPYA